jgi:trimeric autotransporter adhesin
VAGTGKSGSEGDGGYATFADLFYPEDIAVDASGNMYIADAYNHVIRLVTKSTGIITTVAGTIGRSGFTGDGAQATLGNLYKPRGIALDASGNIYIADTDNNRIRLVTKSTGFISTVAGRGPGTYTGDGGQATAATLYAPRDVAVDASGNVYIADFYNNRIRLVTISTGIITTVVGNGKAGYTGDGGPAITAGLNGCISIAFDVSDNLYFADNYNDAIRLVTKSTGIITTSVDKSKLKSPRGIALDASGDLYIADDSDNRIRKVTKSTGQITTVAGTGVSGYEGDGGQATLAKLYTCSGVAVDASGNVYIADTSNNRIRTYRTLDDPSALPSPSSVPSTTPPSSSNALPSPSLTTTVSPNTMSPSVTTTVGPSASVTTTVSPNAMSPSVITTVSPSASVTTTVSPSASVTTTVSPNAMSPSVITTVSPSASVTTTVSPNAMSPSVTTTVSPNAPSPSRTTTVPTSTDPKKAAESSGSSGKLLQNKKFLDLTLVACNALCLQRFMKDFVIKVCNLTYYHLLLIAGNAATAGAIATGLACAAAVFLMM